MNNLKFIQLNPNLPEECQIFSELMAAYNQELDKHAQRQTPTEFLAKWTTSIIRMQGPKDRHLELCYEGNTPIGFLYGKIDHEDHRGFKKPGYGYIMEFYVKPEFRRKGYGTVMFHRLEALFCRDGATNMYLTADPVTGIPFWTAMGFRKTGEISPENQLEIMTKKVTSFPLRFEQLIKDHEQQFQTASKLWLPFIREVNAHDGVLQTDEQILNGLRKRIAIQGCRKDMHFEFAYLRDTPVGIAMFAIDLGTVYGLLEKGYGTVMGLYIRPEYRRKGYGRTFFQHIEQTLHSDGAINMYICPDAVTGVPFWTSLGFTDSGKIDPDDRKPLYIKAIDIP